MTHHCLRLSASKCLVTRTFLPGQDLYQDFGITRDTAITGDTVDTGITGDTTLETLETLVYNTGNTAITGDTADSGITGDTAITENTGDTGNTMQRHCHMSGDTEDTHDWYH